MLSVIEHIADDHQITSRLSIQRQHVVKNNLCFVSSVLGSVQYTTYTSDQWSPIHMVLKAELMYVWGMALKIETRLNHACGLEIIIINK